MDTFTTGKDMQRCMHNGASSASAIARANKTLIAAFATVLMALGLSLAVMNPAQAYAAVSSDKQQEITIASDSLNGNAVRGAGDTVSRAEPAMDNNCYFYSADVVSEGGFPTSGEITAPTSNITYQLGWTGTNAYDGNDCIRLVNGDSTKTVTLSTVGAYEQIYVLATAGGPGTGHYADFEVTLTYTDDTTDITEYKLYDWYDTTPVDNVEQIPDYMRMWIGNSGTSTDGSTTGGPILHSAAISADKTKLLKSITFNSKGKDDSGSNAGIYSTIYAITGVVDDSAPSTPEVMPATNISSTSFTANWNAVSGATSYVIDVATDENFTNIIDGYNNKNVGTDTSINVSVPNDGNRHYYYRVRAVNDSGQSLSSNVISLDVPKATDPVTITAGVTGRDLKPGELTVKIVDPEGNETEYTAAEDGTFASLTPEFTEAGTYEYVVSQVPGEHGGVTYDNSVYTITYNVTEDSDTHDLVINKSITKTKGTEPAQVVDAITFDNTYAPIGLPEANVSANMKIDGKNLSGGELTFVIVDQDGNTVATGKNNADGTVNFDKITLPGVGTYHYTMKLESSTVQGITADGRTFPITITATDDTEGGYVVKVVYDGLAEGETPAFNTVYVAPETDGDGSGSHGNGGIVNNVAKGSLAATDDPLTSVAALAMFVMLASATCLVLARKRS